MKARGLGLGVALFAALGIMAPAAQGPDTVTVMTRNVYSGADWRPVFGTRTMRQFVQRSSDVYQHARKTKFSHRARGLAKEVQRFHPDLIGLQEVALWRSGPANTNRSVITHPSAEHVELDYLDLLLRHLNAGSVQYRVAVVQDNTDFETPMNLDHDPRTGPLGAEKNIRFTLRNAILVADHLNWTDSHTQHFAPSNLLTVPVAGGVNMTCRRGWASVRAQLPSGTWIGFAVTHLEARDSRQEVPSVRARQAAELAEAMRESSVPGFLVGDFNSGLPTYRPGTGQAFTTLIGAGLRDIDGGLPTCCLRTSPDLCHGGSSAEFDHCVDHIFTTSPTRITVMDTWVTGRKKSFGHWHSDHAGLVARCRIDGVR